MYHCVSSGLVTGGDHRAGHARPAGLARLRDVINSWLEETSFRTALTASATAPPERRSDQHRGRAAAARA